MNESHFFPCTHQADQSSEILEPGKVPAEGSVTALSALYNCQVLAFIPSPCCLQRHTLLQAWYLFSFCRSDAEVQQSCAWLNWASSSLWSQGNDRPCMLGYFFYCISQTSTACELANTKQLLVCCTGEEQLLGTRQFFLISTALPPEATKSTAELRRKMPQTHLCISILCCCGQAAITTYTALQNRADKKVTLNIARSRARTLLGQGEGPREISESIYMLELKHRKMLLIWDMKFLGKSRLSYLSSTKFKDVILTIWVFFF